MRKKMICTLAAALIVSTTAAFGAVKEGSFSVTPLIGGYIFDGGTYLDPTLVLGIRGGYNFTKNIGIEALYDYGIPTESKFGSLTDISLQRFGGQALYHFCPDSVFVPYLAAGYSGVKFDGNGVSNKTHGAFDYGVGAKYFVTDDIAVRGDVRHIAYGINSGSYNDLEFTLGAYFQFGTVAPVVKAVVPAPEPVKVVEAPVPEPVQVVAAPAPVPVPVPVVVVPVVIPPADSDGDGVIDTLDKCPGTPSGVVVDKDGCPIDSDKDGVPDYLDKCPGTPAGAAVDSSGCPVDTDKDGVADYLDKCPGTPAGVAVDAKGCPMEAAKRFCDKPSVIEITFDTNKAAVKAEYNAELDKLGNFLKEFPNSKGTIEGYTDADGSKQANLKLSQTRAESVRNYIITKFGIDGSRISAKGYGPAKPVASNKTAAGKAKNRRIEAVFSCE
jgi:OmpA-OmpF porin, OOP family